MDEEIRKPGIGAMTCIAFSTGAKMAIDFASCSNTVMAIGTATSNGCMVKGRRGPGKGAVATITFSTGHQMVQVLAHRHRTVMAAAATAHRGSVIHQRRQP